MEIIKSRDNESTSGNTLKILETPKYLIINTNIYDKTSLEPIKFDILDAYDITFTSWIFILKRLVFTNYNYTSRYFQQLVKCKNYGMVEDTTYPNRFYIIGQRQTAGGFLKCYEEVTDKENNKHSFNLLKEFNNGEYAYGYNNCSAGAIFYCGNFEILHQENEYLIVKQNWPTGWNTGRWSGGGVSNCCSCFKLNKQDFSTLDVHSAGNINQDGSYNYFYMEHNGIYDYIFINWHLNHYVIRFENNHNTTSTIYDNAETGCDITANPVKIGDYYYYLVDEYKRTGKYAYQLCKLKINYDEGNCSYEYIDIEGKDLLDVDGTTVMANITHPLIHECHTIINNVGNYMIIVARSQPNGDWYYPQHKLCVLHIEEDKAIVTQVVPFKNIPCRGVLSYYEEDGHADFIVTLHNNGVMGWKFDYIKEKYINTFNHEGVFYAMGFDEQQRLYLQKSDNQIQMFDNIETCIADVHFANEVVSENLNTTSLFFSVKDYFNNYVKENVIINLYNGVTFEDGSIQKEFMSSNNGETEVQLLITATENVKAQATIAVTPKTLN